MTTREKHKSLLHEKFGRLKVVAVSEEKSKDGRWYYVCQCSCPDKTVWDVYSYSLTSGATQSCGCLLREMKSTAGGLRVAYPREYGTWSKARHLAQAGKEGGMDPAWAESFAAFLKDMGPRPKGGRFTLTEYARGYRPDNCFWKVKEEK